MAKFEELDLKDDIDEDIEITNNDGHVNFSALIEYCTQNKAYTSKNILVSQVVNNLNSNDNQPKSCLIRWGIRKRLDNINQITQDIGLKQLNLNSSESPSIPAITIANISSIYPAIKGGFAFALINSKIHLVQFLALYYHSTTGNYHSYAKEPITDVDIISNVSCKLVMEKEVSTRGEVKFDNDKIQILKRKLREIMQTMPSPPNTKQEKRGFQLIFSKIFSPTSLSWMAANYTFF
ncbi:18874_t:CDS:2 [Entrophospora sp. SA101]|nr:18874_t:CDS:2 [Entrophospora sp. SA101]